MSMLEKQPVCWVHILSIAGVGLILTTPVLINGCLEAHDFNHHLVCSKLFSEQVWQGEFYPRWLQKMNSGFGSPTFFFYAPLPYYLSSLFSPLFHANPMSCGALGLSSLLALVASGLAAYLWLKDIVSQRSAAITSIIYMAWPYHLFVDLYTRFAFAEYWTFVWLPLILYFSRKIINGSKLPTVGLAISFVLLILTHLPTFIIFFPLPIGYALFMASASQRKIVAVRLSLAVVMAIALSAIYWVPAMTTQSWVSIDALSTGDFEYSNNFLFTGPRIGHNKNFWRSLEVSTVLTGGLAFCAWKISALFAEVTAKRESNYWMTVAMVSLFMTLPLSKIAWDILPIVDRIQFPWRFNTTLTVATMGLLALALAQLEDPFNISRHFSNLSAQRLGFRLILLIGILFVLTAIYVLPLQGYVIFGSSRNTVLAISLIACLLLGLSFVRAPINFSHQKYWWVGLLLTFTIFLGSFSMSYENIFLTRKNLARNPKIETNQGANEYRPRWVPQTIFNANSLERLNQDMPTIQVDRGKASWTIIQWQPRAIVFQLNATTDAEVSIHQFYYPGWTAKLQGVAQSLPVHFSELGLIKFLVPAGDQVVSLTLTTTLAERISQIISAISALGILLFVLLWRQNAGSM